MGEVGKQREAVAGTCRLSHPTAEIFFIVALESALIVENENGKGDFGVLYFLKIFIILEF
jgi:hypothetical protein